MMMTTMIVVTWMIGVVMILGVVACSVLYFWDKLHTNITIERDRRDKKSYDQGWTDGCKYVGQQLSYSSHYYVEDRPTMIALKLYGDRLKEHGHMPFDDGIRTEWRKKKESTETT